MDLHSHAIFTPFWPRSPPNDWLRQPDRKYVTVIPNVSTKLKHGVTNPERQILKEPSLPHVLLTLQKGGAGKTTLAVHLAVAADSKDG